MFNFYVISCFDKLYITWNQVELRWNYKGNQQCPLEKDQKDYLHVQRNKKLKEMKQKYLAIPPMFRKGWSWLPCRSIENSMLFMKAADRDHAISTKYGLLKQARMSIIAFSSNQMWYLQ